MPADDRDPKFARTLVRHLHGHSAAACPDAETLAAYHERSLSLAEMTHWKQHISGCAACLETLALVESTEKQLAEDWKEKPIPVLGAVAQRLAPPRSIPSRSEDEAPTEQALGKIASTAAAGPLEISRRRRPPLLRWMIPLGVVAASVLVWIGIHEQRVLTRQAGTVESAQNQTANVTEQKLHEALQGAKPSTERDDQRARPTEESIGRRAESTNLESPREFPAVPTGKPGARAQEAELAKKEPAGGVADARAYKTAPAPTPPPKAPASVSENVEVSAGAPALAPSPAPAVSGGVVGTGAGGGIGEVDVKSATRGAQEKAPSRRPAANATDTTTSAMMMKQGMMNRAAEAAASASPLILTPDHKVWWKLDTTGALQLTTDGGKTWKSQNVSAGAQWIAGSAPSSKICWMAGKAGTLALTTDRGAHWRTLATPIAEDLGGVRATDAKHASIWDAAREQRFETSDGGATWKQTAP